MAWTTPDVYAAAQHMTAAVMNKISANLNALSTHTHTGAAGDGRGGWRVAHTARVHAQVQRRVTGARSVDSF